MGKATYCQHCNDIFLATIKRRIYCSTRCRFESKFIKKENDECWLWNTSVDYDDYGRFKVDGKSVKAHRFSYEFYTGKEIPKGMLALHLCHVRRCMNFNHIYIGDYKDNSKDMVDANRNHSMKGSMHPSAILNEKEVEEIKIRLSNHDTIEKLSFDFDVTERVIESIKSGQNWNHILPEITMVIKHGKYTNHEIAEIKKYIQNNNCSDKMIADLFDCSTSFANKLKLNKIKKWVDL
jgi:hypothetical protein